MAGFSALVTLALLMVKVLPVVPGPFTRWEWLSLAGWVALGTALRLSGGTAESAG